jgi:hypothetical protein
LPEEMSASLVRAMMEAIRGQEALVPEMTSKAEFHTIWK